MFDYRLWRQKNSDSDIELGSISEGLLYAKKCSFLPEKDSPILYFSIWDP